MARTMAGKEEEMAEVFVDFLSKRIKVLNSKNIFSNKKKNKNRSHFFLFFT